MNVTASFIRKLTTWCGDARLYALNTTVIEYDQKFDHIIVSAVNAPFSGPETYIFPADESGEALNFLELNGSFRGDLDHSEALRRAGYVEVLS